MSTMFVFLSAAFALVGLRDASLVAWQALAVSAICALLAIATRPREKRW